MPSESAPSPALAWACNEALDEPPPASGEAVAAADPPLPEPGVPVDGRKVVPASTPTDQQIDTFAKRLLSSTPPEWVTDEVRGRLRGPG